LLKKEADIGRTSETVCSSGAERVCISEIFYREKVSASQKS
ncbi:unnamed protein product, partial [marine sediment metagenome]